MSSLHLHNTLSGRLEKFTPACVPVTMYVCGPTVYGEPHVGNLRPVVVFDVLYRLLQHDYGEVTYVRNITDIDDKIIATATAEQTDITTVAAKYTASFHAVCLALGNQEPSREPKATAYIAAMLTLIEQLLDQGHAYINQGHVLFATNSYADYGKLANRSLDQLLAGVRVETATYKKAPHDFVLWKPSSSGQPGWESPWGYGRPGWHLECSAMINACLGPTIDIHGGGSDLIFPHHENEIAQSRCALQTETLARYWLHNGHITLAGTKMAKSTGNLALVTDVLHNFAGEVVRYALLTAHYRRPLAWGTQLLTEAKAALDRLYRVLAKGQTNNSNARSQVALSHQLLEALHNDLNTPQAIALLHELASQANTATGSTQETRIAELQTAGNFFGLLTQSPQEWFHGEVATTDFDNAAIEKMIQQRLAARTNGDYATADQIRTQLASAGIYLEDSAGTTQWFRK